LYVHVISGLVNSVVRAGSLKARPRLPTAGAGSGVGEDVDVVEVEVEVELKVEEELNVVDELDAVDDPDAVDALDVVNELGGDEELVSTEDGVEVVRVVGRPVRRVLRSDVNAVVGLGGNGPKRSVRVGLKGPPCGLSSRSLPVACACQTVSQTVTSTVSVTTSKGLNPRCGTAELALRKPINVANVCLILSD
jgi:hypothetical protein